MMSKIFRSRYTVIIPGIIKPTTSEISETTTTTTTTRIRNTTKSFILSWERGSLKFFMDGKLVDEDRRPKPHSKPPLFQWNYLRFLGRGDEDERIFMMAQYEGFKLWRMPIDDPQQISSMIY